MKKVLQKLFSFFFYKLEQMEIGKLYLPTDFSVYLLIGVPIKSNVLVSLDTIAVPIIFYFIGILEKEKSKRLFLDFCISIIARIIYNNTRRNT